jgi:hypothetical protein
MLVPAAMLHTFGNGNRKQTVLSRKSLTISNVPIKSRCVGGPVLRRGFCPPTLNPIQHPVSSDCGSMGLNIVWTISPNVWRAAPYIALLPSGCW